MNRQGCQGQGKMQGKNRFFKSCKFEMLLKVSEKSGGFTFGQPFCFSFQKIPAKEIISVATLLVLLLKDLP